MYAASIVEERLELLSRDIGFMPEYRSVSDVDDFDKRLAAKYADEYKAARSASQGSDDPARGFQIHLMKALCNPERPRLTAEETRWMTNERALVMSDAAYFLTRYYWIKNRENNIQRFTFQAGQKVAFNVIAEMEAMRIAVEIILAKARQLGVTTLIQGLEPHKVMYSHGAAGVVSSADRIKTREMVKMIFRAYDALQWWIRPLSTGRAESDQGYLLFHGQDSGIIFQHGKQTNPIAMGSTPITYHLSECSSYPDAYDLIDVGLFKAVHPSPRVFGVLESTCKGDTGWWYDTYWDAKRNWKERRSRLMSLFLPFYCASDMYPNPTERRSHPVPEGWEPGPDTRKMMAQSELYVQSNEVLARVLRVEGRQWKMSRETAWYWERNYLSAKAKGAERDWFQEMPHTDEAAFQGSYENVFGKEVIAEADSRRDTSYHVYGVIGQSIEDRHEPDESEVDWPKARVPVVYRSHRGVVRWEFVPLQWEEPFESLRDADKYEDHMGKLFVYLPPEPGYDYSIGVDTGGGRGRDSSCVAVCRRGRNERERDEQAAEWRSNRVGHVEAWAWVLAIAAHYGRYMGDQNGVWHREPYVAIEQIAAVGDTCQSQMAKLGYGRFHRMTRFDSMEKNQRKANSARLGWYTSGWSRPMLTDSFVLLVQNGWYKVNSPYSIWEMDHWEVHYTDSGKEKKEHQAGATDDGLFANALAAFCPNDKKSLAERTEKQRRELDDTRPKLELSTWKGATVSAEFGGDLRRWE